MTELVDEDILGEPRIRRGRGLKIEDATAPILRFVGQDFDELVGRRRGGVPKGAVVVGQQIPLRVEDVVLG